MKTGGMMSPIGTLKKGIENQDWELVAKAYTNLTGNKIVVPIQEIELRLGDVTLSMLRDLVREELGRAKINIFESPTKKKTEPKSTTKTETKKENTLAGKFDEDIEEHETGKKNWDGKPIRIISAKGDNVTTVLARKTPRKTRPPKQIYKVACSECEKEFESDYQSKDMGQKCHSCLTKTRQKRD